MTKLIGIAAGALLCLMPLAATAQDVPGGRGPTQSITEGSTTTFQGGNWGPSMASCEWKPPVDGRIVEDWCYGDRFDNPDHVIWNEAKRRVMAGEELMLFTASRNWDPARYCELANAGYDGSFVNIQHQAIDITDVANLFDCGEVPRTFAHGVRIPSTNERWIQATLDAGAMILIVPTVDTKEEAEEIIHWAKFPPIGARSSGGGLVNTLYRDNWAVPGGYRNSFNDNIVIIAMLETLQAVENAEEIAGVPGIDAVFAASGDLGNFSGYAAGDEAYEWMIQKIADAAHDAGKGLCGTRRWRPAVVADDPVRLAQQFNCFQGGTNPEDDLAERMK